MLGFYAINGNSLVLAQGIQKCPNSVLAKPLSLRGSEEDGHMMDNYKGKYFLGPHV